MEATAQSNIAYEVGYTNGNSGNATVGGAAADDCDDDGDIDLFITRGDIGPNRLYRNLGNLVFEDIADSSGVANTRTDGKGNDRHSAPTFVDLDGDGDLDLFMTGILGDPNKIYRNRGDCTFEDVTAGSGIGNLIADHAISAGFGDYDLDGDLDLFLTHWHTSDDIYAPGQSEHLFESLSDASGIRFANVSAQTGVTDILWETREYSSEPGDNTLTATFADINDDGWPDIAVAADFGSSQLLINAGGQAFINATTPTFRAAQYGMGAALADIDFDGDLDWFITSISGSAINPLKPLGNRLFRNDGGSFVDITDDAGVADGHWGWGACFLDLDNDTDLDIFHTNGWSELHVYGDNYVVDASVAFVADGAGRYSNQARSLGLASSDSGRGVVCADFDRDGDIDILELTNAVNNSAHLWENRSAAAGNNFLRIKLKGAPPNTEAAGARIYVTVGDKVQMREVMVGGNFTAQHPTEQHFGLGAASAADEVRVAWPARMPGPTQPAEWHRINVPAGFAGQTLIVCHPVLAPAPGGCSASE